MREEFKAAFIGKHTFFVAFARAERNVSGGLDVYVKAPRRFFPMLNKWQLLISNIGKHIEKYDEYVLLSLDDGRTEERVRVFWFDLDTNEFNHVRTQPHLERELESLRSHNNYLWQQLKEYETLLKKAGVNDLVKARMKEEYGFYNGLKPNYSFAQDQNKDKKKT